MTNREKIWAVVVIAFPANTVILFHVYLGSFLRLMGDDYCTVYYANRFGILRSAWYWYLNWAGVYARSLTNVILVWASEHRTFWFIVPGILLIWFLASGFVISLLLRNEIISKDKSWFSFYLAAALIFATLLVSPKYTQSVHWWAGMNAYLTPLVFNTIYVAVFLVFRRKPRNNQMILIWSLASFFIAFIVGGFSETFTPILLTFLAFVIGLRFIMRQITVNHPDFFFLTAGIFGALLALVTMVAAPGNAVRQANYLVHPSMIAILQISLKGYFAFLHTIFTSPEKLSGLTGVFLGSAWLGLYSINEKKPLAWYPLAILALGAAFIFFCFPPAAYGMLEVPPDRALFIPVYILVISIINAGYVSGKWASFQWREHGRVLKLWMSLAVAILMSFSAWNASSTLYNSRHIYTEFAQLWDSVDRQILQAKVMGETSASIPWLYNWTNLEMPNNNPKYWVTICITKYYDFPVFGPDPDISPPW